MNNLANDDSRPIALFFTPARTGGGVARSMLTLASAFAERGHRVDLVLSRVEGPYLNQIPTSIRIVALKKTSRLGRLWQALTSSPACFRVSLLPALPACILLRTFRYLPDLAQYLRREKPAALLSAKSDSNLAALWTRRLAGVPTRVVVSERTNLSHEVTEHLKRGKWQWRFLPQAVRRFYPWADGIVAVSNGVAENLAETTGLPRKRIATIYNPVVTPEVIEQASAPLAHPWFVPGSPPVVLGAGRLVEQKDFPTLLQAFARVRAQRPVRLVLLGEGKERAALTGLARDLGIAADVDLPGFVANPFAYMVRAAVFVLSSAWEGFGNVLAEALACGCPVVSTDCPSGPAEILEHGQYGPLVPVGDDEALANAVLSALTTPPDRERLRARAALFSVDRAVDQYLEMLFAKRESKNAPVESIRDWSF